MPERLMTTATLEDLRTKKADLERQIREMGAESSGHQRASLHDDANAENQLNLIRGTLLNIGDLSGVGIISPRNEVDTVGLGNRVRLQFEDGEETVHLLSRDDTIYRKDLGVVTSEDSPLGKALLGKRSGESAKVQINPKSSFKVRIIEVLPGNF